MEEVVIAIDVGGMSYKGALVLKDGTFIHKDVIKAAKSADLEGFINNLKTLINNLINYKDINNKYLVKAISFSLPGVIDSTNCIIKYSNNIDLEDVDLKKYFGIYNFPICCLNDANSATLGEARFGAAKDYKNVILLTLGTGVGGGVIVNNQLYAGEEGTGAELGHMVIKMNGKRCTCGRKGCFEAYASATNLINLTKEYMLKNKNSLMRKSVNDINDVNGMTAFETYKLTKDLTAKKVINKYITYLSEGILNLCNIFRPQVVLIGGGISNQGDYLINLLNNYCKKYDYGFKKTPIPIIKTATLKNDAGIIGASCFAFENIEN